MNEGDVANDTAELFLQTALHNHRAGLDQVGDTQSMVCHGCQYATKKSWGRTCESWRECLADCVRIGMIK